MTHPFQALIDAPLANANKVNLPAGRRAAPRAKASEYEDGIGCCGGASRKAGVTGDLNNAIPPAYTEWLGGHLMDELSRRERIAA